MAKEHGLEEHKGVTIPKEVRSLADRIRKKENVSDEYAYRTAWDIFRSHTAEGKSYPHKSPESGLAREGGGTGPIEKKSYLDLSSTGALGGIYSGYHSGRSAAGTTASALSRKGYKTKNEETARNIAKLTGAAGALGGLALGYKNKAALINAARKHISAHPDMNMLYEGLLPFGAGTLGGMAGGAATGAATSLRGAFNKNKGHEKKGSDMSFWNGFEKRAAELTTEERKDIPKSDYGLPEEKKYPMPDEEHAANAVARVAQHGTPSEREEVRRKAYEKYPELKEHFKEQHGGKSPTSKEMIKKEKLG